MTKEGGDRRDPEKEKHSRTQATAMMTAHCGADGGRSHGGGMAADSRGPTNVDGAGSGGARGGDREPTSQGDAKDPGAKVEPRALVTEAKVEILGPRRSWREEGDQWSRWDGAMRCS